MHKLGANIDRYVPESLTGLAHAILPLNIPTLIIIGGMVSGLIGLGTGYLTLRLRGAFFAIATLALAVVLQTLIVNWDFVGGSRGAYIIRPVSADPWQLTFNICSLSCSCSRSWRSQTARIIERSRLGYGFATIRDDELAAEACGVPTLHSSCWLLLSSCCILILDWFVCVHLVLISLN